MPVGDAWPKHAVWSNILGDVRAFIGVAPFFLRTLASIYLTMWLRIMSRWPLVGELLFTSQFVVLTVIAYIALF